MFLKKFRSHFAVLVAVAILFLVACSDDTEKEKDTGETDTTSSVGEQVLNLASSSDFTSLDHAFASDAPSFDALYQIFSGLVEFDLDGEIVPDIAAELPEVNDDQTVYTFKLRDDAVWSNGEPVTANDFVYSWQRTVDPDTAANYSFIFESAGIKNAGDIMYNQDSDLFGKVEELGVKALDEQTLEITLERPIPFFVSLMTFPPFYPLNEAFVEEQGDAYATTVDTMIFNGPFVLSEWNLGEAWTYEKNPDYWNADDVTIEQVNYKLVQDAATLVNLYQTDELDYTSLSAQYISQFEGNDELHKGNLTSTMRFLRLNNANEALENDKIRDAIYNAIDRDLLVDSLLMNGSAPAYNVVPKEWALNENGEDFRVKYPEINKLDLEEAQKLWEEGLNELDETAVTIEIMVSEGDISEKVSTFLQSQLENNLPGLTVNINKQPYGQHLTLESERKYDISQWGWLPDYLDPITFLEIWVTDAAFNLTGFSNEEYDALITDALNSGADIEARWEMLQDAENILMEDASVVPLYQEATAYVLKPYVENLIPRNYGPTVDFRYSSVK